MGSSPTWATAIFNYRPALTCLRGMCAQLLVLVEQPGVLACLSRRRSWVQIPSGTLTKARYANLAERRISKVCGCGFDSLPCYLMMAQWTSGCGRHTLNVEIAGSNPAWVTRRVGVHWRAKLVVTQRSSGFGGSNPSRPTRYNSQVVEW